MSSEKILMVEDDVALAKVVLVALRARGYSVKMATTANAADHNSLTVASTSVTSGFRLARSERPRCAANAAPLE